MVFKKLILLSSLWTHGHSKCFLKTSAGPPKKHVFTCEFWWFYKSIGCSLNFCTHTSWLRCIFTPHGIPRLATHVVPSPILLRHFKKRALISGFDRWLCYPTCHPNMQVSLKNTKFSVGKILIKKNCPPPNPQKIHLSENHSTLTSKFVLVF